MGGTLADQWKEFFYCEAIDKDTLVVKGQKRISGRSSNTKGNDNIISNGSGIAVADGQCMIIVEQGKVVEVCAEPGEFTYDSSTEPSIFTGKLGQSLKETFKTIGKRFTYGGDTGKDQRVYYFNTKELIDNKFGTANPIPFRVVDRNIGLDIDVSVRCNGIYSYRIVNPLLFYTNVCGNVESAYSRSEIDNQLKTEFVSALQPAFAKISQRNPRSRRRALRSYERSAHEEVDRDSRSGNSIYRHEPRNTSRGRRRDHQAGSACRYDARSQYGRRNARWRTGRCYEDGSSERKRRNDGLHGNGHGKPGRRNERTGTVPDGTAASPAGTAGTAGTADTCERMDLLLRRSQYRQVLYQLRKPQARTRRHMDLLLRYSQLV